VYRRSNGFVFGYLLMAIAMWKWRPPLERQMETITKDHPIALRYKPWKASGDPNTKEINEKAFKSWYEQMLDTIHSTKRISKALLDEFSGELVWCLPCTHLPKTVVCQLEHVQVEAVEV